MPVTTLKALNNQQNFLRILIFSVVTIMIWIAFSIFRTQQVTQVSEELQKMALPLNPTLNLDVIERIDQKKSYTDEELRDFPVYGLTTEAGGAQTITIIHGSKDGQTAPVPEQKIAAPATSEVPPTTEITPEATAEPTAASTIEPTATPAGEANP